MKKIIFFTVTALFFMYSCNSINSPEKPKEQKQISQKIGVLIKNRQSAINDIQKEKLTTEFQEWFNSYLTDSLDGNINGFLVDINTIRKSQYQKFHYYEIELKESNNNIFEDIRYKQIYADEDETTLDNSDFAELAASLPDEGKAYLYAKFKDYSVVEDGISTSSFSRKHTITVEIDSIILIK